MPGVNVFYIIEIGMQFFCQNAFGESVKSYFKSLLNWAHVLTVLNIVVETGLFYSGIEQPTSLKIFRTFGLVKLSRIIGLDIFRHYQEVPFD